MKYTIDAGDHNAHTALGICECGYRCLAVDRTAALIRMAAHEAVQHPTDRRCREALKKRRTRATRRKTRP